MVASFKVDVAPSVLAWARRSAHLTKAEVAQKLAPKPENVALWTTRVAAWEDGEEQPTYAQLRELAGIYHRPLTALMLAAPPDEPAEVHDFRRESQVGEQPPALAFALRDARERRDIAVELLQITGSDDARWTVSAAVTDDPEFVGARIRSALGVSVEAQAAGLSVWRSAIESAGVLVFGFGGVESSFASGFALATSDVPAIGLNNADAPSRRTFTLLHELTHVALRTEDALCDLTDEGTPGSATERFCNHVAGAVLVPADVLRAEPLVVANRTQVWSDAAVSKLAKRFAVSREVILRRLLILGLTTRAHYQVWRARFRQEQDAYDAQRANAKGGPTLQKKIVSQLGRRYPRLVLDAASRELISLSDASGYLGVKETHFESLAAELRDEAA